MVHTTEILERETFCGTAYRVEIRDDDTAVVYYNDEYTAYIIYDSTDETYVIIDRYVPHHYTARSVNELWSLVDGLVEMAAAE